MDLNKNSLIAILVLSSFLFFYYFLSKKIMKITNKSIDHDYKILESHFIIPSSLFVFFLDASLYIVGIAAFIITWDIDLFSLQASNETKTSNTKLKLVLLDSNNKQKIITLKGNDAYKHKNIEIGSSILLEDKQSYFHSFKLFSDYNM